MTATITYTDGRTLPATTGKVERRWVTRGSSQRPYRLASLRLSQSSRFLSR